MRCIISILVVNQNLTPQAAYDEATSSIFHEGAHVYMVDLNKARSLEGGRMIARVGEVERGQTRMHGIPVQLHLQNCHLHDFNSRDDFFPKV